jgi:hypothetical protein
MLAAKIFDNLIEPWFWDRGIETRNRVANIAAANIIYRRGAGACGEERWSEFLAAFVDASRRPTDEALDRLASAVRVCRLACTLMPMRILLDKIPEGREELRELIEAAAFEEVGKREVLDPVLPTFIFAGERWTEQLGRIVVDFDDTPLVRKFHARLMRLTRPEGTTEYGPDPGFKIPMDIEEIRLVSSNETPQVQIADVIAGACVTFLAEKVPGASRDPALAADTGRTVLLRSEIRVERHVESTARTIAAMTRSSLRSLCSSWAAMSIGSSRLRSWLSLQAPSIWLTTSSKPVTPPLAEPLRKRSPLSYCHARGSRRSKVATVASNSQAVRSGSNNCGWPRTWTVMCR